MKILHPGGSIVARMEDGGAQAVRLSGLLVELCGPPAELLHRLYHAIIQQRTGRLDDPDLLGLTVLVDREFQDHLRERWNCLREIGGDVDIGSAQDARAGQSRAYRASQG
jgi:hypothetical protein